MGGLLHAFVGVGWWFVFGGVGGVEAGVQPWWWIMGNYRIGITVMTRCRAYVGFIYCVSLDV